MHEEAALPAEPPPRTRWHPKLRRAGTRDRARAVAPRRRARKALEIGPRAQGRFGGHPARRQHPRYAGRLGSVAALITVRARLRTGRRRRTGRLAASAVVVAQTWGRPSRRCSCSRTTTRGARACWSAGRPERLRQPAASGWPSVAALRGRRRWSRARVGRRWWPCWRRRGGGCRRWRGVRRSPRRQVAGRSCRRRAWADLVRAAALRPALHRALDRVAVALADPPRSLRPARVRAVTDGDLLGADWPRLGQRAERDRGAGRGRRGR